MKKCYKEMSRDQLFEIINHLTETRIQGVKDKDILKTIENCNYSQIAFKLARKLSKGKYKNKPDAKAILIGTSYLTRTDNTLTDAIIAIRNLKNE